MVWQKDKLVASETAFMTLPIMAQTSTCVNYLVLASDKKEKPELRLIFPIY
ncbi:hypothetical protein [uncultured Streptococcus sp.]|uniref:hypothetical protein n=1 Tax=uncultured Streptococcus sp. TaxID=83427 RepID=UPI0025E7F464|nr:hypothetical protein [uncultured Streptococcus sp.]